MYNTYHGLGVVQVHLMLHGRNVEVTPALRQYVEKKVTKLEKYFEFPLKPQVVLSVQKEHHKVEITIPLNRRVLRAEGETGDMYASLDDAVDKIERQIHKYKTRINRKAREVNDPLLFKENAFGHLEEEVEEEPKLVRTKRFTMKPMDVDEAILEMNLLDHDFFVFTNAETDETNVVYRRRDGNYGLIEPEV